MDCYCECCELLSASKTDALLFVNILVSGIFHERFAQQLAVNKPCLQIVRHLLWKQTTTHSIRNNNPMFDGNLLLNSKWGEHYLFTRVEHLGGRSTWSPLMRKMPKLYVLMRSKAHDDVLSEK